MKSMTGYGVFRNDENGYEVEVSIASVNRRHTDLSIRLEKEYGFLEPCIRAFFGPLVYRGQITVTIFIKKKLGERVSSNDMAYFLNEIALLRSMAEGLSCKPLCDEACFELWKSRCISEPVQEDRKEIEAIVLEVLAKAFDGFCASRKEEGEHLLHEFLSRIAFLKMMVEKAKKSVVDQTVRIKERLLSMLNMHVPGLSHEDHVLREIVLYADKADVSEEISRIEHHLAVLEKKIKEDGPIGKMIEFILQELLRELNTLGAKTVLSEVSTDVVFAKVEIEKMREQVSNVE